LTIDDLLKLPVVVIESSAPAVEKDSQGQPAVVGSTSAAKESSAQDTATDKDTKESAPVIEATEEAEIHKSITDQVTEKILEVAAPVTAAAAAAGAAVAGLVSTADEGGKPEKQPSSIPGTFPETPVPEEADDETAKAEFAAALAADKETNTAPTLAPSTAETLTSPPEKNESFGILPIPSATAPEGTKPLAKSTYQEPTPADVGSLTAEPVAPKEATPVPPSKDVEPVTNDTNILSSAPTDKVEQLESATLQPNEDTAQTAAKAPAPVPTLDARETLSELANGPDDKANVEPAIVLNDTNVSQPTSDTVGTSESAPVAPQPVTVSADSLDGVQEVNSLRIAVVADKGKEAQAIKALPNDGKAALPESVVAHLSTPAGPAAPAVAKETTPAPAPPPKDYPSTTPTKTPASVSSAGKDKRTSGVLSESGSEKKKKRGGFLKRLRRIFS
jgi:hypothetical protein